CAEALRRLCGRGGGASSLLGEAVSPRAGILLQETDREQRGHVAVGRARAHAEPAGDVADRERAAIGGEAREDEQSQEQRARQPRALRERLVARGQRAVAREPAEQARDPRAV